jgi:hypothetical protein
VDAVRSNLSPSCAFDDAEKDYEGWMRMNCPGGKLSEQISTIQRGYIDEYEEKDVLRMRRREEEEEVRVGVQEVG